jgi:hypothetical protein
MLFACGTLSSAVIGEHLQCLEVAVNPFIFPPSRLRRLVISPAKEKVMETDQYQRHLETP